MLPSARFGWLRDGSFTLKALWVAASPPSATASSTGSSQLAALCGRELAAFDLMWHSMRLVSLLIGGLLADSLGIQAVYYGGGGLLFAARG